MTVSPAMDTVQAFHASRDAAVQRLQPTVSDKLDRFPGKILDSDPETGGS
jgi:hypothetical protein